jgi:hypothetical protein
MKILRVIQRWWSRPYDHDALWNAPYLIRSAESTFPKIELTAEQEHYIDALIRAAPTSEEGRE